MACSCKGKKNVGVTKTPIRKYSSSSNGHTQIIKNNTKRIIKRDIR